MNTNTENTNPLHLNEDEKFELEKDLLHFAFIKHIQQYMDNKKKKDLAKELGVSSSFVTQLFAGDKKINIDLMVKMQRALDFKFTIDSIAGKSHKIDCEVIPIARYTLNTKVSVSSKTNFSNVHIKVG